jgi:hypothetical protein
MHISAEHLRSAAHRTEKYGSAAVLSFQPNCTILRKPFNESNM